MKVYTYFTPVPELPQADELALIELWKKSWSQHGWTPVVLSPKPDNSKEFENFYNKIATYPSINAKKYEMACMLRWWFLREAIKDDEDGGLMVDYDVMNYGFRPSDLLQTPSILNLGKCPCAVFATVNSCTQVINHTFNFNLADADVVNGKPYVHDQVVIRAVWPMLDWVELNICKEPTDYEAEKYKLIHFSNGWSYKKNKRPRYKHININRL